MISTKIPPEEFLHFVWENRLFDTCNNYSEAGDPIEIISTGRRNRDSGPDFFNAKIKIGETIWVGNVEVHKLAGDWDKHKHHTDKAYNNVVLHVVEINDRQVFHENGESVPAWVLKYPVFLKTNYQKLLDARTWIACQSQFHNVDQFLLKLGFNRLMVERLEDKTNEINKRLKQNNNDWNEAFYQELARMFGFRINALPFELLAKSLPMNIIAKHKDNLFQIEALLFGSSGLLNEQLFGDDYFLSLRKEYTYLCRKYGLKPIDGHLWKFMRLRPVNFPTIRIAQFAALLHRFSGLFSKIIEIEDIESLQKLFKVTASTYWENHFSFNKTSRLKSVKELGTESINTVIVNVVVPFLFVYGESQNKEQLKNRSLEYLEKLPAESNSIIRKWEQLGVLAVSAFDSQALLQLKNKYCEPKN